ncbi:MAG: phosphoribosylanthranilate isomerase [Oligoflexales bacterium]|nr:phosphoribosylanthranilate isomerase [Oligoflexales bacterium]
MKKTKIKVCGITRAEDAIRVFELGGWAIGFVFWPGSPRYIKPKKAGLIVRSLEEKGMSFSHVVGVFVNPASDEIREALQFSGIDTVQLHGDEDPGFCNGLEIPYIKAFRLRQKEDTAMFGGYGSARYFLVDASVQGSYGGTGRVCDWNIAREAAGCGKLILSGGLGPSNIKEAVSVVQPFAVDLSSGVEERAGVKSHTLLEELFNAVE